VPDQHQRLDKHFHGLKSWVMFQHVAYRISLETLPRMAAEFFGIRLFRVELLMFKAFMAEYYKTTYHKLLQKILSVKDPRRKRCCDQCCRLSHMMPATQGEKGECCSSRPCGIQVPLPRRATE
jgi:hypothetical protein